MYEELSKSPARPFRATPDSQFYFPSESIEAARKTAVRASLRAEGPVLILGGAGLGKSLLAQIIAEDLSDRYDLVMLHAAQLCSRRALLQNILFELGMPYRDLSEGELRLSILDRLVPSPETAPDGVLLIVDEAHTLSPKLLEELRLITNFTRNNQPRTRLILLGNLRLEDTFARPQLDSLNQRLAARCYLHPMSRQETHQYIRHQLNVAGVDDKSLVTLDSLDAVHNACDGLPRLINQLMDHSMVLAAEKKQAPISASLVEEAWAEIQQLPAPWHQGEDASQGQEVSTIEFGSLDDSDDDSLDCIEYPQSTTTSDASSETLAPTADALAPTTEFEFDSPPSNTEDNASQNFVDSSSSNTQEAAVEEVPQENLQYELEPLATNDVVSETSAKVPQAELQSLVQPKQQEPPEQQSHEDAQSTSNWVELVETPVEVVSTETSASVDSASENSEQASEPTTTADAIDQREISAVVAQNQRSTTENNFFSAFAPADDLDGFVEEEDSSDDMAAPEENSEAISATKQEPLQDAAEAEFGSDSVSTLAQLASTDIPVVIEPGNDYFSDRPTDEKMLAFADEQAQYDSMGVWENDPPIGDSTAEVVSYFTELETSELDSSRDEQTEIDGANSTPALEVAQTHPAEPLLDETLPDETLPDETLPDETLPVETTEAPNAPQVANEILIQSPQAENLFGDDFDEEIAVESSESIVAITPSDDVVTDFEQCRNPIVSDPIIEAEIVIDSGDSTDGPRIDADPHDEAVPLSAQDTAQLEVAAAEFITQLDGFVASAVTLNVEAIDAPNEIIDSAIVIDDGLEGSVAAYEVNLLQQDEPTESQQPEITAAIEDAHETAVDSQAPSSVQTTEQEPEQFSEPETESQFSVDGSSLVELEQWTTDVATTNLESELALQNEIEDIVSQLNFSAFTVDSYSDQAIENAPGLPNSPPVDSVRTSDDQVYLLHRPNEQSEENIFTQVAEYDDDRDLLIVEEDVPVSSIGNEEIQTDKPPAKVAPYNQLFAKLRR